MEFPYYRGLLRYAFWLGLGCLFSAQLSAVEENLAPESATGIQTHSTVIGHQALVVSAHPLASRAGMSILRQGGTAADAAVAIQAMLTLVEPQSSGIGGGGFMLYWDAEKQMLNAYDGRETAPATVDESLFMQGDTPVSWQTALVGGRAVGVPGVVRMLDMAHRQHGKQPWKNLFQPAIHQAHFGFSVTPRLHKLIASGINPGLNRYEASREYFYLPDGSPLPVGYLRKNPALAYSLTEIANRGADAFYTGPLAAAISKAVQTVPDNPGHLSNEDLSNYKAVRRSALCQPYLAYRVCGFPPPTSGGIAVLQILKLLEQVKGLTVAPDNPRFNHLFTQASRLAFADRQRYLADSDFVPVPVAGLLNTDYLKQRAALMNPNFDDGTAQAGQPPGTSPDWQDSLSPEQPSTSHFVVVDQWGNAMSMTSSIEMAFGSTLMVGGFLLNNQLTDFSFTPRDREGKWVANRVQPGKRPRSSMAPFMVFDQNNQLYAAVGSPGGSRIISYVAQSLLLMLNTPLSLQEVVSQPHISNRNGQTELEADTSAVNWQSVLEEMGHDVKIRDLNSGLHAFRRLPQGGWESGVDPRREGRAISE
ncbi:gamma-glutamyltransferase [Neptuniibacter sp. CAU 1671]|uniref:gamma-glutamyltransferase n=1 Tax=Neptuniibacter sp. CAU 1671 TaxID=3032593 RepID=UPI0023DA88DD|nr:gamma-glutamyltransferase [Neptuniibacter sp. CAU 1671]MDF2182592.1 gamma-glutamyltransferase [Neptuniibacter sp. CAU 1671]